jgi:competence protein ComEC
VAGQRLIRLFILAFVAGIVWLQQQPTLPDFRVAGFLPLAVVGGVFLWRRASLRFVAMGLALFCAFGTGFYWAAWRAEMRLADELPRAWEGKDIQLTGVVAALPQFTERGVRFDFDVEEIATPRARVPRRIQLFWFASTGEREEGARINPARLRAGERWQFVVRLKRPHGTANPHGFDYEAFLLERGIRATGYVHKDPNNFRLNRMVYRPGYVVERMRDDIAQRMKRVLLDQPYGSVLVALAIGDQGAIPQSQWRVFTRTGVNHLMSISGLHVTMFSGMVFTVFFWVWRRSAVLTERMPAHKVALAAGALAALGYTLLTGFAVPAQRTFYMVATVAVAAWSGRITSASRVLALALLVVTVLDPWAVLAAGFWLSFGAVAVILYVTAHRVRRSHWLVEAARVQWAVTVGLVPALLVMFQQVSIVSPIANAFAIPVVSLAVVPVTLAGAFLPLDFLLHVAHRIMALCMTLLETLSELPAAVWQQHAPPVWTILAASLGILWLLGPRGMPARWVGGLTLVPMFVLTPPAPESGALDMTVLDVGQGLSVVLRTSNHALVYDAGPRFGSDVDSGSRIVLPYLRATGVRALDGLIVSHDDIDHAGGAISVLDGVPVAWLLSPLEAGNPVLGHAANHLRCVAGQRWQWDGVTFHVLHPTPASYGVRRLKDNDRGCVLRISTAQGSVLIAADIEARSERELLARFPDALGSTVLVVPHHGSRTSSSLEFVRAVHPQWAIFAVGYRNRFGHPKEDIVDRYRQQGSHLLRTDETGAVHVLFKSGQEADVRTTTKENPRYWKS